MNALPSANPEAKKARQRGMALTIVLIMMVLFATLATAIFLTASAERQNSSLFAAGIEAKQLVDTSLNLCMAQIRDATSGANRAWVSQPGLIRTYTGNRNSDVNYRLYSWADMRPSGAFNPFSAANAVPSGWRNKKASFVDLNEPAPDTSAPTDATKDKYPIFYPPTLTGSGNNTVAGYAVSTVTGVNAANEVPMPVQWLYMLQDGSVQQGVEQSNTTVQVSAATATNPIVGRIAFWGDDESAKVNLNTSAGGYPWMPPWVQNLAENTPATTSKSWGNIFGMGYAQPMKNEFQRYPGHPATTDVRTVFPELSWRDIYLLAPRVIEGGSQNGINRTRRLAADNVTPIEAVNDRDRLFSGLGEVQFRALKSSASDPRSSLSPVFLDATISPENWNNLLEKRKAFLTVSSRAPELNLFGQPRVAIWPVPERDTAPGGIPYRTAIDKLIAFCSTLTNRSVTPAQNFPFFFDRRTGGELNIASVPKNTALSADADITRTRNTQLFRYLQRLTDSPFPGVSGAALISKYGGARGRDQICTEIFDYIRSTNIQDKQANVDRQFNRWAYVRPTRWNPGNGEVTGFGRGFSIRQFGFLFICNADASVPASNRAPGEPVGGTAFKENQSLLEFPGGKLLANQRRIQALLIVEFFSPSAGFKSFLTLSHDATAKNLSNFSFRVRGLDAVTLNGTNLQFPGGAAPPFAPLGRGDGGKDLGSYNGSFGGYGGAMNYRWPYIGRDVRGLDVGAHRWGLSAASTARNFPYVSMPVTITIDPANPEMTVGAANLVVEIFSGYTIAGQPETLIETIPVNLDSVTLPVPRLHPTKTQYWAFHTAGIFGDEKPFGRFDRDERYTDRNLNGRYDLTPTPEPFVDSNGNGKWNAAEVLGTPSNENNSDDHQKGRYTSTTLIVDQRPAGEPGDTPYDVLQTYILPHGDYRTLFAPSDRSNRTFIPVPPQNPGPVTVPPALNPPRSNMRHFLSDIGIGGGVFGYTTGTSLAPATGRRFSGMNLQPMLRQADYPAGLNAPWTYGDWDTGSPLNTTDGPLVNKADEGSTYDSETMNPYANAETESESGAVAPLYHSANRQIPSAVMFGSLPTGLISGQPWQTLLFRPDPGGHPGAVDPPDHLLLDLFWMPIVEPYAISEPFSTAGKVNMNYQMIPFTYIERSTAVRAVLQSTQIGAIPEDHPRGYSKLYTWSTPWDPQYNLDINIPETLQSFQNTFSAGSVFLTPSEITTLPLVPAGRTLANTPAFWNQNRLTGENIKERPYATIYPRLTTKSNVFNIHYRVQTLRKQPGSDPALWDESKDKVVAQKRGNTIIERYLDMNRPSGIPDYALPANANLSAESLYRFRILSSQEFNP